MKKSTFNGVLTGILTLIYFVSPGQDHLTYQTPDATLLSLVDAPLTPAISVSPDGTYMLLLERPGYPGILELVQPELRLAGLRINPRTNGPSRSGSYTGITIKEIHGTKEIKVTGMPAEARIENVSWSPGSKQFAFTITNDTGIELWTASADSGASDKLTGGVLNDAIGFAPFQWFSDGTNILYKAVIQGRGEAPAKPIVPQGPTIQESTGTKAAVRTYQDLLNDKHDENLFRYYSTSQLHIADTKNKTLKPFGTQGIITQLSPSPDGNFIMINYVDEPFSYIVPYSRFPQTVAVYDRQGKIVSEIAKIPLSEDIPKGFGATREGPRSFTWRNDKPATIYWVEAQDGGDPARETDVRDKLFYLEAPFTGKKKESISLKLRYGGITWGNDNLAIAYESWFSTRQVITSSFKPSDPKSKKVIFDRSYEDRYSDPGNFNTIRNNFGENVLQMDPSGKKLYLIGTGASPEGNRPFVREFDIASKQASELWRSEAPYYEIAFEILSVEKGLLLTRRESKDEQPNYFVRNIRNGQLTQITQIPHPYPQLKGVQKQVVTYKRADGVDLKGDLYLPAGYKMEQGRLPVLMWAYPAEFKSAEAAGQMDGSPYEFIRISGTSPLLFVARGYAVFDDPSMPIIGEGDKEPNDSFVKQLVMSAEAAVNKLVELGIADRRKIAIGGHSYGAFMTANLLAHSDLFAAGIARSGAYNRTLTPFGFQREERTYWEAPEVYYSMSPFMHADKINEPMLMIHGHADNNSGTFPIQSERMFAAMKGHGGKARLVMLPHESHGYRARESILHVLWETDQLLENYVKNRPAEEEVKLKVEK
jgi:dipeptidyl aminopeptidase/acylaminoacyl peptidase